MLLKAGRLTLSLMMNQIKSEQSPSSLSPCRLGWIRWSSWSPSFYLHEWLCLGCSAGSQHITAHFTFCDPYLRHGGWWCSVGSQGIVWGKGGSAVCLRPSAGPLQVSHEECESAKDHDARLPLAFMMMVSRYTSTFIQWRRTFVHMGRDRDLSEINPDVYCAGFPCKPSSPQCWTCWSQFWKLWIIWLAIGIRFQTWNRKILL